MIVGFSLPTPFDSHYTLNTDFLINGYFSYDGYTNTRIYFHNVSKLWHMERLLDPSSYATTVSAGDYPFGSHTWNISSEGFMGKATLNLNGCHTIYQYNCVDGTCINIKTRSATLPDCYILLLWFFLTAQLLDISRCDGKTDCNDGSDEMHCEKIYMTKADINTIPAPPSKGISLTGITLSVELISELYCITLSWWQRQRFVQIRMIFFFFILLSSSNNTLHI